MQVSVKVRDVMDKNLVLVGPETPVSEVIRTMVDRKVWSVLVGERGLPVGVVTERDILRRCLSRGMRAEGTHVGEIMSSPLLTIGADAPIGEAMHIMASKNVRRLYVIEAGKAIGRVTQTSVFGNILETMETLSAVY